MLLLIRVIRILPKQIRGSRKKMQKKQKKPEIRKKTSEGPIYMLVTSVMKWDAKDRWGACCIIASKTGISQNTIRNYEYYGKIPSLLVAMQMAKGLKIPLSEVAKAWRYKGK